MLLLFLALAAVPGSVVPQQSSDPNGVITFDRDSTGWAWAVSLFQLHDVFGSTWFSAIYLLLFISLVGCVIPRIRHHARALRASPPDTPPQPVPTRSVRPHAPSDERGGDRRLASG